MSGPGRGTPDRLCEVVWKDADMEGAALQDMRQSCYRYMTDIFADRRY